MRVEDIKPGMKLARNVYDPNGNVLIRAGITLTERHLKAFKSWGIQEAAIGASEAPNPPEAKASEEIQQLLDSQFGLSNRGHPVVEAIYDFCLQRALDQG